MNTTNVWRCLGAILMVLMPAACGGDVDDGDTPPGTEATFETFNVGLAPGFVPFAEERVDPVADAVAQSPADAVCLQEAWLVQDEQGEWVTDQIDAITDAAQSNLPHSYVEITRDETTVGCTAEETAPLQQCVDDSCADVSLDDLAGCALSNCGAEFGAVSTECQSCITGQIGNPIDEIVATCQDAGASEFSYDGHNGLALLSRHEFTSTEFITFDSTLVRRSALHAVMSIPDFGDVDVYCTHLTANLEEVPYQGEQFDGYEEEQRAQVQALLDWVDDTATTGNVVIMGDMNNGPAKGEVEAEFPANYQLFVDAGLEAPYIDLQAAPECTFCEFNTLTGDTIDKAIDHVFLDFMMPIEMVETLRVYDETQPITVDDAERDLHLSDHFGVRVTVEERR